MAMRADRIWVVGGAATSAVVIATAWFAAIHPKLADASSSHEQAATAQAQNDVLQTKIRKLSTDGQHLPELIDSLKSARDQLPIDSGLPAFTRQIAAQAVACGVTLVSISASPPTALTGKKSSTPTPAATSTAAATSAAAAGSTSSAATKGGAVAGKLYLIPVTIVASGTSAQLRDLITKIQTAGPRRALLQTAQFAPAAGGDSSSIDKNAQLSLQLQVFSAPQTPANAADLEKLLAGG